MSSPTLLKYEIERQLLVDLIPHTSYRVPQTPTWASPLDPAKGLSPPDPHFCGVQKNPSISLCLSVLSPGITLQIVTTQTLKRRCGTYFNSVGYVETLWMFKFISVGDWSASWTTCWTRSISCSGYVPREHQSTQTTCTHINIGCIYSPTVRPRVTLAWSVAAAG